MLPQLSICTLIQSQTLRETLQQTLDRARCAVVHCGNAQEFLDHAQVQKHHIDCAILEEQAGLAELSEQLQEAGVLLPVVIMSEVSENVAHDKNTGPPNPSDSPLYHQAEVWLLVDPSDDNIAEGIHAAVEQFLDLSNDPNFPQRKRLNSEVISRAEEFLMKKQRRLTEKLRERLGYLGVYYKRNPQRFLRNLPQDEQQAVLQDIQKLYREVVLDYFSNEVNINPILDELVNIAFFADISVTHIVEIHMELMDEFSKQLKLEGRSEEILLDYRLTLIDAIAHLCEMYRRSIPREL
ncbi:circadian clock protein KaiA [Sodalinema gerasimenkoae]|uniref:circadian clock protein KaiA n=1 Tax=Sodalinema gerasimenkoae TaxID=2862348 RepID=UPI00135C20C5|nr:circadian clock protein KaiA [Sodalinema gerasimenkoae]